MSTTAVEQFLYFLDGAFEGPDWHSLLGNLGSVTPADWLWVPPGGRRTIRELVGHLGACKIMYDDHAFRTAQLTWAEVDAACAPVLDNKESAIAWLREGQARLRQSVAALDDDELLRPRRTNWGKLKETRWIIAIMIQHDLYHAGEINHIRCLSQQNDE